MAEHGDALDFDLFDRWRVRLRDVPATIGWDAVALFIRHLPYGCAVMREMYPQTVWSIETHRLADIQDMLGTVFSEQYRPMTRPGSKSRFSDAQAADDDLESVASRFRKEAADG